MADSNVCERSEGVRDERVSGTEAGATIPLLTRDGWPFPVEPRHRPFREYVTNRLMAETGKSRGEITERILDVEWHTRAPIANWVKEGGDLETLLRLLKQLPDRA